MIDIKVPAVGESISEVTLLKWVKGDGEYVNRDEVIAELESEKATFEVNAEQAGVLKTMAKEGDTIAVGSTIASIDEQAQQAQPAAASAQQEAAAPELSQFASAPQVVFAPDMGPAPAPPQPVAAGKGNISMKVPTVGESINEVTLLKWVKKDGEFVKRDEVIAELESEKATFELNAEEQGQLKTQA